MQSAKYSRTFHYPFSPGATNDDRINNGYWYDIQNIQTLVHTEKLDGENNCLSRYGVFARSHAAPTVSPWTADLRIFWESIKKELGTLEVFLENLYAVHSLRYRALGSYYYVFAIRDSGQWLSWDEVKFYANMLGLPTVPEIAIESKPESQQAFERHIARLTQEAGRFSPQDIITGAPSIMEGIVSRNANGFSVDEFEHNVFKWVRRGHVKTDEHWTRNWKRAKLKWEGGQDVDNS